MTPERPLTVGERVALPEPGWCGTVTSLGDGVVWVRWDCFRRQQPHLPEHLTPATDGPTTPEAP